MFIDEKVKDIMVPIDNYAVCKESATLKDAISSLRKIYCEVETGECTEAGHRALLVIGDNGDLVGMLDFASILKVLVPEVAGSLSDKLMQLGASIAFAEANIEDATDESKLSFQQKVAKNAAIQVKDVMLRSKGQVDSNGSLLDALKSLCGKKITVLPVYEDGKLVGVLRDSDIFLKVAEAATV
jgi:CBS domain-containing protein